MSCLPSYTYTPTFTPSDTTCTLPAYNANRSRLFGGGTYFRSKLQGSRWNSIRLTIEDIPAGKFTATITHPDYPTEIYTVDQSPGAIDEPCSPNGIDNLRSLINVNSLIIEMYGRGLDIEFDPGGEDDLCLSVIAPTYFSGGQGGPSDGASLAAIRTGPSRSILAIQTMEAMDGTPVSPPPQLRTQQWNGTEWVEYSNTVPGNCPI